MFLAITKRGVTKIQAIIVALLVVIAAIAGYYAAILSQRPAPEEMTPQEKWLKEAKLGPYAPKEDDWDEIVRKAKEEGKVVVYSFSARIFQVAEKFKKAFPEIEVEAYDLTALTVIEKVIREQEAGIYHADVLFLTDYPSVVYLLLKKKYIWNYVPSNLTDLIPEDLREPILVHDMEAAGLFYNNETYKTPPIDSWWDLTRPEWKGKFCMKDPTLVPTIMHFFTVLTMPEYVKMLEDSYLEEFGKPLKLDPKVPNAAFQLMKDLVKNDIVFLPSDGAISKAVGTRGQEDPPIGLTYLSQLRHLKPKNYAFDVIYDLKPFMGFLKRNVVGIANMAPHPNAAKLFILFFLGDEKGGKGYAPFFRPGTWSSRKDMALPPGTRPIEEYNLIDIEKYADYIWASETLTRQFWTELLGD